MLAKVASVVPVFKKPPKSNPCHCRTVSLLPILSKAMESVVNHQLVAYLERYHLLPDSQYGFRQGHGTADVLTALQNEWTRTVASGGCVPIVAVDIAGAFDRVSHCGLIHKVQQAGVRGSLLAWLQNYLIARHLQVIIGCRISDQYPISAGVPQGSVLGPTLFTLYDADIDSCLVSDTRLSSFADDTTVYALASRTDLPDKVAALQQSLDQLHAWGRKWHIRFEPAKSQHLVLSKALRQ